jgi:hypothetical protein
MVCRFAGNEDAEKRAATIAHTWSTSANVTGWQELTKHLDAGVVGAARGLLDRDGDGKRELAELAASLGKREVLPTPKAVSDNPLGATWGDWSKEPPPIDFVVEGLLPRGAIAMLFGAYDTCKTWLTMSLLKAVSLGEPWLGRFVTKKGRVLFVDLESGDYNTRRRLYMLRAGDNPDLGAACYTELKPNDPQFWIALAKYDCEAVVIDSLRVANNGADENDSSESIVPLLLAARFSELTGCAVVWIHHANKSATDGWPTYRGSSGIMDQVDCAFAIRRPEKTSGRVEIKCVKPGDMRPPEDFAAEVVFDDAARLATVKWSEEATADATPKGPEMSSLSIQATIRTILSRGPVASKNKILQSVGVRRQDAQVELDEMLKRGEVVEVPPSGFQLDDDAKRLQRVLDQVRDYEHWMSAAKLAEASYVPRAFVEKLVRDRIITPRVNGGGEKGGYFVAE